MHKTMIFGACMLMLIGCDNGGGGSDAGHGGIDSGSMGHDGGGGGGHDAGHTIDSGSSTDPCAAEDTPTDTVGCNGGILGADRDDNDFGGICTLDDDPEANPAGTCTNANALCWGEEPGGPGICLTVCTPEGGTYVSTGGCPTGSRCFDLEDDAFCFPDCNSGTDCASDVCDGEGSCSNPEASEPEDGGVPADASTPDGGALDGGALDGGTADAGTTDT